MNDEFIRKIIDIKSLAHSGKTIIPTGLTFDNTHRILKKIHGRIKDKNGTFLLLPIVSKDRKIFLTLTSSGDIEITTSKDERETSATVILEYKEY